MCGIAGILDFQGGPVDGGLLRSLCAALAHRGPDDEGYYHAPGVGLGQRRLSIIDLSTGRQPMGNEDGTVWVTFNGEIYNFREVRADLERRGHRFSTGSDTEVIVHAYEEYGEGCLDRFRGMFAFAVWDDRARALFLARDRAGKKPLFYARTPGGFAFASELHALLRHPGVPREVDPRGIDDYLTYGYIPAPRTAYRGVWKLPPAHCLKVRAGGDDAPGPRRYWRLAYGPKLTLAEGEAAEGLLEVLTEAVRLRLIADVPLGALLSGGIDSSLVVALMSRLSDRPVKTFSIGFDEREFNELPYARLVADRYGTDHHELIVRPDAAGALPVLVRHYGEPYADSSAVPSYYVAALTRRHVTVALNGDGGDESFAGYERYLGSKLAERYRRVPAVLRAGVVRPLTRLIPGWLSRRSRWRQAKRFIDAATLPFAARYLRWVGYFSTPMKQRLYSADFRAWLGGHDAGAWLLGLLESFRAAGPGDLDALLATDVESYLPYDLLVKMDIATMAHSLEARSPFLDHKVMEYAARLPDSCKIRGLSLKHLLKRLGGELLPAPVLRRRKMGFGVPVGRWMRAELRPQLEATLLSPEARTRDWFDPAEVRRLFEAHTTGREDYSYQLWALFWLELWRREFAV